MRCACACVEESCARAKRGDGTRAHAPTPAAGARVPSCSPPLLRAVGHPVRARVNFSARERAQVRDFFCGTRALLPFPSEVPLGCGWGGCGRGFVSLAHPTSLILLWLLEFEEERSRGRRGWVCRRSSHVSLALSPSTPPARTPADRTVLSFHRFALLLPLRWPRSPSMSGHACSSPQVFLLPTPLFFPHSL